MRQDVKIRGHGWKHLHIKEVALSEPSTVTYIYKLYDSMTTHGQNTSIAQERGINDSGVALGLLPPHVGTGT